MQNSYTIPDNLRGNPTHGICDRKINLFFFVTDAPLDTLISVAGKAERKKQMNEKHIKNLLILAFEGGSNYWYCELAVEKWPDVPRSEIEFWHRDVPLMGGVLVFKDQDRPVHHPECKGEGADPDGKYRLTREKLLKGFEIFKKIFPRAYGDLLKQEDDAETGDCFLQACIFGEELYG